MPHPYRVLRKGWETDPPRPPRPGEPRLQIAEERSQTERRAAEAERELVEWKKVRFMQDRVGEEFAALILNPTKFGLFVELTDLFVEGLVPIDSLRDDYYTWRETLTKSWETAGDASFVPAIACTSFSIGSSRRSAGCNSQSLEEGIPLTGKRSPAAEEGENARRDEPRSRPAKVRNRSGRGKRR